MSIFGYEAFSLPASRVCTDSPLFGSISLFLPIDTIEASSCASPYLDAYSRELLSGWLKKRDSWTACYPKTMQPLLTSCG